MSHLVRGRGRVKVWAGGRGRGRGRALMDLAGFLLLCATRRPPPPSHPQAPPEPVLAKVLWKPLVSPN